MPNIYGPCGNLTCISNKVYYYYILLLVSQLTVIFSNPCIILVSLLYCLFEGPPTPCLILVSLLYCYCALV